MRSLFVFLATFLLAMVAGLGGYSLYMSGQSAPAGTPVPRPAPHPGPMAELVGSYRPDFALTDLSGAVRRVAEWDGKVLLVNFWATWCPPCRREIPTFVDLQQEFGSRGLAVIGIAIDQPDKVRQFVKDFGVPYVNLLGDEGGTEVSFDYGNRMGSLPYSAIIDRQGSIVYTHLGEVKRETVLEKIQPLL